MLTAMNKQIFFCIFLSGIYCALYGGAQFVVDNENDANNGKGDNNNNDDDESAFNVYNLTCARDYGMPLLLGVLSYNFFLSHIQKNLKYSIFSLVIY